MRLLDWVVVGVSLLVLIANRLWLQPAELSLTTQDSAPSPFAYIRADGSEVYLPAGGGRSAESASKSDTASRTWEFAVYSWTSSPDTLAPR